MFLVIVCALRVPEDILSEMLEYISGVHETEKKYHHDTIKELNSEMELINTRTDKLTDLLLNDLITKEVYDRKLLQLQTRRKEITVKQQEHQEGNEEFKIALSTLLTLASKASGLFESSKTPLKRTLVTFVSRQHKLDR
ncbi:MAG: hypothetical protein CMH26_02540 [Micavibrio sp.]|nr:hypothetical protein [Micavibrio sp.]|tara:strand:- start:16 stop:432 length:417 start_codon:yes stop_codon:yes gene_type:complete